MKHWLIDAKKGWMKKLLQCYPVANHTETKKECDNYTQNKKYRKQKAFSQKLTPWLSLNGKHIVFSKNRSTMSSSKQGVQCKQEVD